MLIKSSSALRNDYDNLVKIAKERQEPVYITRNGEGEMVFLPIAAYEKREAELNLLSVLLESERERLAGAPVKSVAAMRKELDALYAE